MNIRGTFHTGLSEGCRAKDDCQCWRNSGGGSTSRLVHKSVFAVAYRNDRETSVRFGQRGCPRRPIDVLGGSVALLAAEYLLSDETQVIQSERWDLATHLA